MDGRLPDSGGGLRGDAEPARVDQPAVHGPAVRLHAAPLLHAGPQDRGHLSRGSWHCWRSDLRHPQQRGSAQVFAHPGTVVRHLL